MALRGLFSKYLFGCPLKKIHFVVKTGTVVNINSFHAFSLNIFKHRQLSSVTGDYEKLWDAVTGGRGTGRGKKRTKPKDKESAPTGFGKFGKKWPGLDTPVRVKPEKGGMKRKDSYSPRPQMSEVMRPKKGLPASSSFVGERQPRKDMPAWKKAFIAGEKMYGQDLSRRGWSGKTWRGREFGPPETATGGDVLERMDPTHEKTSQSWVFPSSVSDYPGNEVEPELNVLRWALPPTEEGDSLEDFQSIVLELRRVSNMTPGGRKRSQRAIVVVGNKNGAAGFAVGKAQSGISALKKAKNKAAKYLYYVNRCEDRTIYHDFVSTHRKTKIKFERKPPGYGLRCHRIIRAVADCIGIEDMRCKITGSTTPISVVRAAFQGLLSQETHEQLAERKGLHVVECRPENSMRPMVVASPSPQAAKAAEKQRTLEDKDYDFDEIFDPYKGAHRPRKVKL